MHSRPVIQVRKVSKLFHRHNQHTVKEFLPALLGGRPTTTSFWALRHLSFDVLPGESFGIIGTNGSGKSTLLKLIAGVTQQTEGKLRVHGRVAPLIELGAGFHPELTGRENIFLNGIILGLRREEIREKFDSIVAFSELAEHIDQPVKHYSSGMYLRLAYAVAIHTDPDIVLIDEILAVGDEGFQKKCLAKVREFQRQGVTIILISHDRKLIAEFTDRTLLLDQGKQVVVGPTKDVLKKYDSYVLRAV